MEETQLMNDDPDRLDMIWWIPREYWVAVNASDPTTSPEDIKDLIDMLEGYELFAIIKGSINSFGGVNFSSPQETFSSFKATYKDTPLTIISEDEVPSNLKLVFNIMKPIMQNILGPMGENMNFVVAEKQESSSVIPIDIFGSEILSLNLGDYSQTIQFPLNSVLKEKICPKGAQRFSGKWNYCPFHGSTLEAEK